MPNFRKPKSKNAATTLLMLGMLSVTFLMSILLLARATGAKLVEFPAEQLVRDGVPVGEEYVQHPVLSQLADAVFRGVPPAFYLVTIAAGLILVLAANTAFNGFPVLGRSSPRTATCPSSCTRAATGWRSPTASSRWRSGPPS